MVFPPASPVLTEKVEPEAVLLGVVLRKKTSPQARPLLRVYETLEDRELHTDAKVLTGLGDTTQASAPLRALSSDVITDDYQHSCFQLSRSQKRRVGVEIAS